MTAPPNNDDDDDFDPDYRVPERVRTILAQVDLVGELKAVMVDRLVQIEGLTRDQAQFVVDWYLAAKN